MTSDNMKKQLFQFTPENIKKAEEVISRYPNKRSAVMPLLYLAQEQHENWIPVDAMDYIAKILEMPPMHVYEVANFYTMYNKKPVGKNLVQICRTTPCWLKGASDILEACKKSLNINVGETTDDKKFTLMEVECLGACVDAPVVQINNDYYENLTTEEITKILENLRAN